MTSTQCYDVTLWESHPKNTTSIFVRHIGNVLIYTFKMTVDLVIEIIKFNLRERLDYLERHHIIFYLQKLENKASNQFKVCCK